MFQDRSQSKGKRRVSAGHDSAVTIITPGCHFNGKLFCKGSSRIGGKVEGEIVSEGLLIIEKDALIIAEVKAEEVVVQGAMQGSLNATNRVEFASSSCFEGTVVTKSLMIEEGAKFNGQSSMPTDKSDALNKQGAVSKNNSGKKSNRREPEVGVVA